MNKKLNNQNGQVLLFVIVIMTISLSVGVSVSTRTLSSLSRVATEDTANKALSAAESAIEQMLVKSQKELTDLVGKNSKVTLTDDVTNITTETDVKIEKYSSNSLDNSLVFTLDTANTKEINLQGYSGGLDVCWDNNSSAINYSLYDSTKVTSTGILKSPKTTIPSSNLSGNITTATEKSGGSIVACYNFSINNLVGLRIKSLYQNSNITIKPQGSNKLAEQGFKITATGKLLNEGKVSTSKTVIAYRSYNYIPSSLDTTIYLQQDFNN